MLIRRTTGLLICFHHQKKMTNRSKEMWKIGLCTALVGMIMFSGCVMRNGEVKPVAKTTNESPVMQFVERFQQLQENFDPRVVELFADDAVIRTRRAGSDGKTKEIKFTGSQYKNLMKKVLPLAKQRNDRHSFSNLAIKEENGLFRVTAYRRSHLKCYTD